MVDNPAVSRSPIPCAYPTEQAQGFDRVASWVIDNPGKTSRLRVAGDPLEAARTLEILVEAASLCEVREAGSWREVGGAAAKYSNGTTVIIRRKA